MHLKPRWIDRRVYEYFAVNVAPWLGWRDPILVYQMGKVGSSSVRNSLFRSPHPHTRLVLMSHEFYPVRNRDPRRIQVDPEFKEDVLREIEHDRQVFEQLSIRKKLGLRMREKFYSEMIYRSYVKPGYPLRVITLVREPVANNISMFFQLLDQYVEADHRRGPLDIEQLIQIFLHRYQHARPLIWLDAELKTMLGIDVYQFPFDREQGYEVIRQGHISLLMLKCELEDRRKAAAIAGFLGLDSLEIVRSNVGSDKQYADQYTQFKRSIRIPTRLLDRMYQSKYARFFYSEEERAQFRARWS
jgi:hypothetical protein